MTNQEIEQATLGFVNELYNSEYIGSIKVERTNQAIKVSFGLSNSSKPIVIIADLDDEKFLKFLKEELRYRKLHFRKYFKFVLVYPEECPTDSKCKFCK